MEHTNPDAFDPHVCELEQRQMEGFVVHPSLLARGNNNRWTRQLHEACQEQPVGDSTIACLPAVCQGAMHPAACMSVPSVALPVPFSQHRTNPLAVALPVFLQRGFELLRIEVRHQRLPAMCRMRRTPTTRKATHVEQTVQSKACNADRANGGAVQCWRLSDQSGSVRVFVLFGCPSQHAWLSLAMSTRYNSSVTTALVVGTAAPSLRPGMTMTQGEQRAQEHFLARINVCARR